MRLPIFKGSLLLCDKAKEALPWKLKFKIRLTKG